MQALPQGHPPRKTNPRDHPAPGTTIVRFAKVDDGIYKGSKPKTDADFRFLRSIGIINILELRFLPMLDSAERALARKYGMGFKTIYINASPVPPSPKHVNLALLTLRDKRLHPIYFHCDIGRDRTSLIEGLYDIYFRGMSKEDAWREMKSYGFKESWTLRGLKTYFEKHAHRPPSLDAPGLPH